MKGLCWASGAYRINHLHTYRELNRDDWWDNLLAKMRLDHTSNRIELRRALGTTKPPDKIMQVPYEGDDRHLRRLVRLGSDERPEVADLLKYVQDLRYAEIETPSFLYLLPLCLEAWRDDLRGIYGGYGGVIENFYPVLADRQIFDLHLAPKQSAVVSEFMRQTILEEIDDQRGLSFQGMNARPIRWFRALTTFGVLLPDVDRLWMAWWPLDTIGRSIAAVQYISCLMYSEYENPIFSPWTPNGGGGPPCLWEFEGHLYTNRWLDPNVTFLKGILSVAGVGDVLSRAVEHLIGEPEHEIAALVLADFPLCTTTLEARCAELPHFLGTTRQSTTDFEWSR